MEKRDSQLVLRDDESPLDRDEASSFADIRYTERYIASRLVKVARGAEDGNFVGDLPTTR